MHHDRQFYLSRVANHCVNLYLSGLVQSHLTAVESTSSYGVYGDYEFDLYGEAPDKMTYTEQANKRSHCTRLTR